MKLSAKHIGWVAAVVAVVILLVVVFWPAKGRFYVPHVESEIAPIQIQRFDQEFFALDSAALSQKYGSFVDLYLYQVLHLPSSQIPYFQKDSAILALQYDIAKVYGYGLADSLVTRSNFGEIDASQTAQTMQEVEQKLTTAWAYYHHYFPTAIVPNCRFHLSGFNQSVITAPGVVSASIENYLGANYPLYAQIAYQYELPYMTPRHLPIDMVMAWLISEYPDTSSNLLEAMVYQGKLLYVLQVFFPHETRAELLSYTEEQLHWCEYFEKKIWTNIVEQRELFSTDWRVITRYTQPAPFTKGYSQEESPGRVGAYMGLRLVEEFMQHNTSVSLQELMNVTDAQQILQLSGYRP